MDFEEKFITAGGGSSLFLRSAKLEQKSKASVLLTHGMGEHSGRYRHVAEFLAGRGYRLCTYDLRGHGRSGGRRGYIQNYDELLDDLAMVKEHYARPGEPMFLYGHSMGGQITLNYMLERRPKVQGAIVASPWLELSFRPSRWKLLMAKIMLKLWPTFTQDGPDDDTLLSRDATFLASMPERDLLHHKMSARMYHELLGGALNSMRRAGECDYPLLMIHGAEDPLTSAKATEAFFKKVVSKDKTLKIYPDMLHETHNEIGREGVLGGMAEWMGERSTKAAG
ncbi:MAG: lysophospholipase [Chthoniobacteraceae bacterium]